MNCINMAMFFLGRKVWGCMVLWWHLPFCWGGIFIWMGSILSFCVAGVPFCFPFFLLQLYRNRYGQLQFVEANTYMEQFLYSFQKSGKVLVTLKDVEKLLAKGRMHTCIRDAITYIEKTYGENQVEAKALSRIEQEYPLQQMATMTRFARR